MSKKLFYLPLESYQERYTHFMSCKDGWAETWFKKYKIDFVRVEGESTSKEITTGVVLDAFGRSVYSFTQLRKVVDLIEKKEIKSGDVVYTEDFWTPGIEALFYIRHLTGVNFKVACFFHAQSVDDSDFTYPMRDWIRHIEIGLSKGYDYIFVTSNILKNLCKEAGLDSSKIHVVGLPYNSQRLLSQLTDLIGYANGPVTSIANLHAALKEGNLIKRPYVLFSSRFDDEKNPNFFLNLVEACPNIQFKLVKPRKKLSNNSDIEKRAFHLESRVSNFQIVDTSNKLDYYNLLAGAEIQINTAYQDWTSWTLLEAITFGCKPLYPNWKDFPYELEGFEKDHLYEMNNLEDCKTKLHKLFNIPFNTSLRQIVDRHDLSWRIYLAIMDFEVKEEKDTSEIKDLLSELQLIITTIPTASKFYRAQSILYRIKDLINDTGEKFIE